VTARSIASRSTASNPDRADILGAAVCLVGVAVIVYARY
jgi:drug/metabolite transporter superfamily protein YnfA